MLELRDKKMPELRAIAKQIGLPGVKAESADALRARIAITMEPSIITALTPPELKEQKVKRPIPPMVMNTPEQVIEALTPFKDRLKLAFYNEAGEPSHGADAVTWHVRNGAAEDSGSLSVPIKWILFKASEIAKARFPAVLKGEFEASRTPVLG